MDEVIEQGFYRLRSLVTETKEEQNAAASKIEEGSAELLSMMATTSF